MDNKDKEKFAPLEGSLEKMKSLLSLKSKSSQKDKDIETELHPSSDSVMRIGEHQSFADRLEKTNKIFESIKTAKKDKSHSLMGVVDAFLASKPLAIFATGLIGAFASGLTIKSILGVDGWDELVDNVIPNYGQEEQLQLHGQSFEDFTKFLAVKESPQGSASSWNNWADGRDFSSLTVDQVLAEQEKAFRENKRTKAGYDKNGKEIRSTAYGTYQVVHDTLKKLERRGIVNGNDKFDSKTQQKIGWFLFKDAGFLDYVHNQDKEESFVNRLLGVWEGLKKYPRAQVISMVRTVKAKYLQEQIAPTTSEKIPLTDSNIQPEDVIQFTSATGDRAHFDLLQPIFRSKILRLAKMYFDRFKRKMILSIAYRDAKEQNRVNKKIPYDSHMQGLAIDTTRDAVAFFEPYLNGLGLVSGTHFSPPDPIHIQSKEVISSRTSKSVKLASKPKRSNQTTGVTSKQHNKSQVLAQFKEEDTLDEEELAISTIQDNVIKRKQITAIMHTTNKINNMIIVEQPNHYS